MDSKPGGMHDASLRRAVFVLMPAQGAYAGPYKLSTDWHSAWHGPCSAMDVGGSGPEIRCLMRNMKPVLSAYADPAKNKLGGLKT